MWLGISFCMYVVRVDSFVLLRFANRVPGKIRLYVFITAACSVGKVD